MWLKTINLQEVPSFDALSMLVSREHGDPVSDETTRMLMEATETAEPEHWKPPADPLAVVARSMVELMKSLGQEPTAALLKIAA
ncbi:hypothetical protein C8245_23075 [Paracidovorax avenae]|nr:hypothetical protein C8245_23075 [Paracidovorax avenae]